MTLARLAPRISQLSISRFARDAQNPICGTAHNVASPEMLYVSGSSGAQFDECAEALHSAVDVVGMLSEATYAREPRRY